MNIEEFKKNGYAYLDIKVEEDIIDRIVEVISERDKQDKDISEKTKHQIKIAQPWLIPECIELALRDDFLSIPALYFSGKDFYLGSGNLRRTRFTKQPAESVLLYHRDQNLGKMEDTNGHFFKIFVYLNDIDENSGPFTYVEGSNNRFDDGISSYRKPDREVHKRYPNLERKLVGKKGQVIAAMTHGIHKGSKPTEGNHRDMLTINYATSKESVIVHSPHSFKIDKALFDGLSGYKKDICKHLVIQE
jgi:hypothetical protein